MKESMQIELKVLCTEKSGEQKVGEASVDIPAWVIMSGDETAQLLMIAALGEGLTEALGNAKKVEG